MKDNKLDWCNLAVKEKREKVEGKPTHYLEIDEWKPTQQTDNVPPNIMSEPDNDSLPF
jgi:hypothetical protein